MSSHHFVKEGQEPALLVVDALADDHLLSLLEWSPMVLAVAQAIPKVASWGIRVDVIFLDSLAHNESVVLDVSGHIGPAVVIEISTGLAEEALSYLRRQGQHALQVMIHSPEQHFHKWEQSDDFEITLIDLTVKWSRISTGRFEKWLPDGARLHVRGSKQWSALGGIQTNNQLSVDRSGIVQISSLAPFWIGEEHR